jgi:hypothetical protein|tara:strand:+ start:1342 stop:1548 length:207 start_codon:yes stop_codon:yes gene_type:complete
MVKPTKDLKTILHFKKGNYVYRYVLVDRFKNTAKVHYGFDSKLEKTEKEIWALENNRKLRRKYILKNE